MHPITKLPFCVLCENQRVMLATLHHRAGDRLALCLGNLEAKSLERGVVAAPGSVKPAVAAIALVREVGVPF